MITTSYIEISKSAIKNNLKFIRQLIGKDTDYYAVIKGNAYGHGIEVMSPLLQELGQNNFAVFDTDEAHRVYHACLEKSEIMIMGFIDAHDMRWAIEEGIQFYVFDLARLEKAIELSKKTGAPARVHVEVETGFHRTGFSLKQLKKVLDIIEQNGQYLQFEGLCTHFAGAENVSNYFRIEEQGKIFQKAITLTKEKSVLPVRYHTACSAATLMYPNTQMDMVRVGILTYGFWPTQETRIKYIMEHPDKKNPLRRVVSWKSRVMAIQNVKEGDYVGYGASYVSNVDMKIAIIPVGYAYGFSRSLSNIGRVLINGKRLPVAGLVNMNMITVALHEAPDVKVGDEVVLIGRQKNKQITVASFSELSQQLNYELLTRLPLNIPRYVVR